MAFKVNVSHQAIRDLIDIFEAKYADVSRPAAVWYIGLRDAVASLANMPGRGAVAPDNPKLRQILYGHKPNVYRILYSVREQPAEVNVVEIRHTAREPFQH